MIKRFVRSIDGQAGDGLVTPRTFPYELLRDQDATLRQAIRALQAAGQAAAHAPLSFGAEWLLDNAYVVAQAVRQARADMPPEFLASLPRLDRGPDAGFPRIYLVAEELVRSHAAQIDSEGIHRFMQLYEDTTPHALTIGELWALPVMLNLCVLEHLAHAASRMCEIKREVARIVTTEPGGPSDDQIIANGIGSLRELSHIEWTAFVESLSRIERALRDDPAQAYASMDAHTRDRYRKAVETLARRSGTPEGRVAQAAVDLARQSADPCSRGAHVGCYLLAEGRPMLERALGYRPRASDRVRRAGRQHAAHVYLGSIAAIAALLITLAVAYGVHSSASPLQAAAIVALLAIPAVTAAVGVVNWAVTTRVAPSPLPKMDYSAGIPDASRAIVVIPCLLSSSREVRSLLEQIELHYLRNPDPNLRFALLSDLVDAPQQAMPGDDVLVAEAISGIDGLNARHPRAAGAPFLLLHRERRWNPREQRWMGWERKRGKLHELNRMLRGDAGTSIAMRAGDMADLADVKYVITLDADTILPRGGARRLIATLAHPLNRAVLDETGRVAHGYTIVQPRVEIMPESASTSAFTRIFVDSVGLDLYSRAVSDVYQDLFGAGIFVGKGILDVDAFERSLRGRVPENALLSHDLFEGIHGRVGLATDVILYEDYPPHYLLFVRRAYRWLRGDWQLLPWLFPRVPRTRGRSAPNDIALIDRWKIADNLRRSMLAPALLALLISAWLWLPGAPPAWIALGLAALAVPCLTGALSIAARVASRAPPNWRSLGNACARWLLAIVFIPYEAILGLGGIAITLIRLYVTRQNMLEWVTAAHASAVLGREVSQQVTWRQMLSALVATAVLAVAVLAINPAALVWATPFLLAWLLSPQIAFALSRPAQRAQEQLEDSDRAFLRRVARRTWLFFEQFVGPGEHWLPPDNFQEQPLNTVVSSTSPTNIAMLLLSTLSAYDLGYIGLRQLAARLESTFDTLGRLERYRNHFLNWYDARTLQALTPRYVSTVDSGNLAASLCALAQGCLELSRAPVLRWVAIQGWLDAVGLLDDVASDLEPELPRATIRPLREWSRRVRARAAQVRAQPSLWPALVEEMAGPHQAALDQVIARLIEAGGPRLTPERLRRLRLCLDRSKHQLDDVRAELSLLQPWLELISQAPAGARAIVEGLPVVLSLSEIPDMCRDLAARLRAQLAADEAAGRAWRERAAARIDAAGDAASGLLQAFEELAAQAQAYVEQMDFGFLYDARRALFHIGYNLELDRLDANYYDLLASEARLASLVAIGKNEVPPRHWLQLGRPITELRGGPALLSWSATAFEYLMPHLLTRAFPGTLLHETCRGAVERQIEYGVEKRVPWGISESGYFAFDANQRYQYRAFGVPGLGFKRGLEDDLVIAPYGSALALPFRPRAVVANLRRLAELGMLGAYGYYEAADYTPERQELGQSPSIVRSYMAHHQGMSLVALNNALNGEPMVRRFNADPAMRSTVLLQQERVPVEAPREFPKAAHEVAPAVESPPRLDLHTPWAADPRAPFPQVCHLSNGRFSTAITAAGAGFCRWQAEHAIDLTRWRGDATCEDSGVWLLARDEVSGEAWSLTLQPHPLAQDNCEARFYPHMAELRRDHAGIAATVAVAVADDDVEVRRVTLVNTGDRPRTLVVSSYGEAVLAPQAADARHPAFNKLFISAQLTRSGWPILERRLRNPGDQPCHLLHALVLPAGVRRSGGACVDRPTFHGVRRAHAGIAGAGSLDPIFSVDQRLTLQPGGTAQLAFITCVANSRAGVEALAQRHSRWRAVDQAFEQARARVREELLEGGMEAVDLFEAQRLLAALLYPNPSLRSDAAVLRSNQLGQSGLWAFGVSGDHPMLLVRVHDADGLVVLSDALRAHAHWRRRKLMIDLIVLNEQGMSYSSDFVAAIKRTVSREDGDAWLNRRGGIFIVHADQMSAEQHALLETTARVALDSRRGSLAEQLDGRWRLQAPLPPLTPSRDASADDPAVEPIARPASLQFDNGLGGFSADGREYVIYLEPGQVTPAPWANAIANAGFGCVVTESGLGHTWALNSAENRLTPWSNDPVLDPQGEAVYVRDEESGAVWSPTRWPRGAASAHLIRHGAGYSVFATRCREVEHETRVFVAHEAPVKIIQLRVRNMAARPRRLTVTYYAEWVLGALRDASAPYVVSEYVHEPPAVLAHNRYHPEFGERAAFAAASKPLHGVTTDRLEFLGRHGSPAHPAALDRVGLAGAVEAGHDPCAALQLHLDLPPGGEEVVHFAIGQGADRDQALQLAAQFGDERQIDAEWRAMRAGWDEVLGAVQVRTPDPAMDLMLNRWLMYPALSSRILGRTAFYQSSGAYGFRDQLQDVLAVLHARPDIAREHILRCARHQFEHGDVLHWWHPPTGRGVRTRCSDDMLWLPYATAHYVRATGDVGVLDESIPFLQAEPLRADEDERYGQFGAAERPGSLYDHCLRALQRGDTRGKHGLPLMQAGDWNDGMNRVGVKGSGESVWLGWFLGATLAAFAGMCERRGDADLAQRLRARSVELARAIEAEAWDGSWYLRAFFDDGSPLGSTRSDECQIDAIAQSWAVLSGLGDPGRSQQAMESVLHRLVRVGDGTVLLFTPPFTSARKDPGYIAGYPPGVRENGGQYTHAAIWTAWAFAALGDGDQAAALFQLLNPIAHAASGPAAGRYRVEPYAIAADVYGTPPHTGRGGWTWYTGSNSWMYRLGLEGILGIRREGERMRVAPCIPRHWPRFEVTYRLGERTFDIDVLNPHGACSGVSEVWFDGARMEGAAFSLDVPPGRHRVRVVMAGPRRPGRARFE